MVVDMAVDPLLFLLFLLPRLAPRVFKLRGLVMCGLRSSCLHGRDVRAWCRGAVSRGRRHIRPRGPGFQVAPSSKATIDVPCEVLASWKPRKQQHIGPYRLVC